jgi:DNA-binding winged helix-turn-helix (wHTH) protein
MANASKNGASTNVHRFTFDNFEVDPANRILLRDGEAVALNGKASDILLALVENPGRLLEKDELLETVWPGDFVEEGNLTRNVSFLRKALGDLDKQHKYIATVQGHGYRFVSVVAVKNGPPRPAGNSVVGLDQEAASEVSAVFEIEPPFIPNPPRQLVRRPPLISFAGICFIVIAVVAFQLAGRRTRQIDRFSLERLKETKLAQFGNSNAGGWISPDGQYLLYGRSRGNERGLWLRQISTGSSLELRPLQDGVSFWAAAFASSPSATEVIHSPWFPRTARQSRLFQGAAERASFGG